MTLADLGSRYDDFYTPRFLLRVGGSEYGSDQGLVSSVSVDTAAEKADRFSFTLDTAYDAREGRFPDLDWGTFDMGTDVEIDVGYGKTTETILVGSIAEHRVDFPRNGSPQVDISGYGLLHEMQRNSNSRSWDETTDSDVAKEVANEYRFETVTVEETDTQRPKIVQNDETDHTFLERLAEPNSDEDAGYRVTVRRDEFIFGTPPSDEEPTVTLPYGDALQSFSPEYRTGSQVGSVEVRGYDSGTKSGIVGTAKSDTVQEGSEVVRRQVDSQAEAETAARARLDDIESDRLTGRGESIGLPEIQAGKTVELSRLGDRFSREYYVESASHTVGTDGYTTSFTVRLPEGVSLE
jgi:phage protein D